jgi:hypothetical protein
MLNWLTPEEASEDPGCTRGLPGVGCSASSNLHDKLERLGDRSCFDHGTLARRGCGRCAEGL